MVDVPEYMKQTYNTRKYEGPMCGPCCAGFAYEYLMHNSYSPEKIREKMGTRLRSGGTTYRELCEVMNEMGMGIWKCTQDEDFKDHLWQYVGKFHPAVVMVTGYAVAGHFVVLLGVEAIGETICVQYFDPNGGFVPKEVTLKEFRKRGLFALIYFCKPPQK